MWNPSSRVNKTNVRPKMTERARLKMLIGHSEIYIFFYPHSAWTASIAKDPRDPFWTSSAFFFFKSRAARSSNGQWYYSLTGGESKQERDAENWTTVKRDAFSEIRNMDGHRRGWFEILVSGGLEGGCGCWSCTQCFRVRKTRAPRRKPEILCLYCLTSSTPGPTRPFPYWPLTSGICKYRLHYYSYAETPNGNFFFDNTFLLT